MKTIKIILTNKKDENGIALLFTLGVLSLLLVLAIAFATTSMTAKKQASNSTDRATARMLAHSALQKAVALLRYNALYNYGYEGVVSHIQNANENYYDFLWRMETQIEGLYYMDWPGYNDNGTYNPNDEDMPHWHYVDNGKTGDDKRIIGRYAYKVIPDSGKLDPNVTVRHSNDIGGAYLEANLKNTEVRNGMYQHEINIWNLDKNNSKNYLSDSIVNGLSSKDAGGKLPDKSRWVDFETMFSELGITDSDKKTFFREVFALHNPKDPEAFWIDDNGDGILQSDTELYHRFNLARTDWDTITVDTILGSPTRFDNSSTHDGTGILWLKNCSDTTRAQQIAANLIDYCDSDRAATTDNEDDPTYTGNDLTPYINEVGVRLEASARVQSLWFGAGRKFTYSLAYSFSVELINIYGGLLENGKTAEIEIEGKLSLEYTKPDSPDEQSDQPITGTINFNPDFSISSGYAYSDWVTGTTSISLEPSGLALNSTAKITNVTVKIEKVKLKYDGNFADFASPGTSETIAGTLVERVGIGGPENAEGYFSFEANDPRQNLKNGDWEDSKKKCSVGASPPPPYPGTLGGQNSGLTFKGEGDKEEDVTAPTALSTAFIRNAPMRSPWELGAIHRGAKWETLNLKLYNSEDGKGGVSPKHGLGDYSKGDANILDQVKMTPECNVYGKINLQDANEYVLAALLADIRVGNAFYSDEPGDISAGTQLDYTGDIGTESSGKLVQKIIDARNSATIKTRAQICSMVAEFYGASTPSDIALDNDMKKEEIVGKFINLTKGAMYNDTVPVVIIAQSIKDVGTLGGITIRKDLNMDGDTDDTINQGDPAYPAFYGISESTSETIANVRNGFYDRGADEITGECKILAFVRIDPITKRPVIMKLIYPELE